MSFGPFLLESEVLFTGIMATMAAMRKGASLMETAQFLVAQGRVLKAFHLLTNTQVPYAIGFVRCAEHPSPIPALTIFSTSLPITLDSNLRSALKDRMERLLRKEAPDILFSPDVGRCCENTGFVL